MIIPGLTKDVNPGSCPSSNHAGESLGEIETICDREVFVKVFSTPRDSLG